MAASSHSSNWLKVQDVVTNRHDTYPFIDPTKANLSGKSVFITGASKGIGKAIAISFAKAGCQQIALAARSPLDEVVIAVKAAAQEAGRPEPHVLALAVDVSSEEAVRQAAETVSKEFGGKLDMLIANAGYQENSSKIGEGDPTEWWKVWEVNIRGVYLTAHYFLPLVLASQSKTVVVLSSAGAHNIRPGQSAYQSSKFTTCRFVEFLDAEYQDQGLVAVAVHPGGVKTELALRMPEFMHAFLIDKPELPGDVMVWLAAEPRGWLSGRFISAVWDLQELEKKKEEIQDKNLFKFRMTI
jgi:NAD(P)-dependent dehydrogenase (short-subunit alcohol dehydrogenase family)